MPATCGEAMLVPLMMLVAESLSIQALSTLTPGAKMSTMVPKLEKEAMMSLLALMAPTVMAEVAEAGESFAASDCGVGLVGWVLLGFEVGEARSGEDRI